MTDPWGDHALREHLRPYGHEPFFATEEPTDVIVEPEVEPEQEDPDTPDTETEPTSIDVLADAARTALYSDPDPEPIDEPTNEGEPIDDPERRDPAAESIAGRVLTVFRTFPREKLSAREIAETLNLDGKQVLAAIEHLRRQRQPVFGDGTNKGIYEYDETRPVGETVLKKSSWYRNYRPKKRPKTTSKGTPRMGPPTTPDLLEELGLHDRAVITYEALARLLGDDPHGTGSVRIPVEKAFNDEERELFPTKSLNSTVARYLSLLGSVTTAGPMKDLRRHPDDVDEETREKAFAAVMTSFATIDLNGERRPPAPRTVITRPKPVVDEERGHALDRIPEAAGPLEAPPIANTGDDLSTMLELVEEDRLAAALANGMWTRYEWALTELGKASEQIAVLQEAVRARDEEIQRLRAYVAKHLSTRTVKDIAAELLTQDQG